jgi:type IV pilus assembly protein PilB
MYIDEKTIISLLNDSGLVTKTDISIALKKSKETNQSLGLILVSSGKLTEKDWNKIQAMILGIPFVNLEGEKINPSILALIPEPIARNNNIIAYNKTDIGLEVAILDIEDLSIIDFIKKKVGLRILPRLTTISSIRQALSQYKKSPQSKDLSVIRIVDTLISNAVLQGASDIHIEPEEESLIVRYRIDGVLHDVMTLSKDISLEVIVRIKILSNLKLNEVHLPQDGRFKVIINQRDISLRVSTLPTYFGEKIVIRILRENSKGFSLEGLGFHGEGLERIHDCMKRHTGMIIVAGPVDSGKTTTLYTMLDILNTSDVNISTIEDPIEYQMTRINQTQINPRIGLTFANGLRTLLQQDPDIIMVGEIRDRETVSLSVNASLIGHFVLSTINTNSAVETIPYIINMGVEPVLIVSTIKTIIAKRLVRTLSINKEKYFLHDSEIKKLGQVIDLDRMLGFLKEEKIIEKNATWKTIPFYKPKPDEESNDGYKGRLGIHEVLRITPTIKEMILTGASINEIEEKAKEEGMMTILEDGIFLAAQGVTSIEEVFRTILE